MSSLTKLVLIGVTAVSAFATVSAEAASQPAAVREKVLASHRQVVSATPVAHHRHRHHHGRHVARPGHR